MKVLLGSSVRNLGTELSFGLNKFLGPLLGTELVFGNSVINLVLVSV